MIVTTSWVHEPRHRRLGTRLLSSICATWWTSRSVAVRDAHHLAVLDDREATDLAGRHQRGGHGEVVHWGHVDRGRAHRPRHLRPLSMPGARDVALRDQPNQLALPQHREVADPAHSIICAASPTSSVSRTVSKLRVDITSSPSWIPPRWIAHGLRRPTVPGESPRASARLAAGCLPIFGGKHAPCHTNPRRSACTRGSPSSARLNPLAVMPRHRRGARPASSRTAPSRSTATSRASTWRCGVAFLETNPAQRDDVHRRPILNLLDQPVDDAAIPPYPASEPPIALRHDPAGLPLAASHAGGRPGAPRDRACSQAEATDKRGFRWARSPGRNRRARHQVITDDTAGLTGTVDPFTGGPSNTDAYPEGAPGLVACASPDPGSAADRSLPRRPRRHRHAAAPAGHDLRRTFITLARVEALTIGWLEGHHARPTRRVSSDVYTTFRGRRFCTEIAKLHITSARQTDVICYTVEGRRYQKGILWAHHGFATCGFRVRIALYR